MDKDWCISLGAHFKITEYRVGQIADSAIIHLATFHIPSQHHGGAGIHLAPTSLTPRVAGRHLAGQLVGLSDGQTVGWTVGPLVGPCRSDGRLDGHCVVSWLVGRSDGGSIDWSLESISLLCLKLGLNNSL